MLELLQLEHATYLGIIVVLILTGAGLPVPEEVPIIAAGVAAYYGQMNPWLALAACFVGALLGDCVMYAIGYHFGHNVLRDHPWCARFLKPEREAHLEEMINQHGWKVFLAARFLVGLRSPVYLTAGILRVPFRRFLLVDLFCAGLVICTFFGLSYLFAERITGWFHSIRNAEVAITVLVVTVVASVVLFFYIRHRRRLARIRVKRQLRSLRLGTSEAATERKNAG
ncbi:MAG TPA: DedA family protein [Pirellulales bacterium]|jgi:membrane protein DedA with SNARE-associated domain